VEVKQGSLIMDESTKVRRRKRRWVLAAKALVPVLATAVGGWYDHRLELAKQRDEVMYGALSAPLKEMQAQVSAMAVKVDLLQALVLAREAPRPAASPNPTGARTLVAPPVRLGASGGLGGLGHGVAVQRLGEMGSSFSAAQRVVPNQLSDIVGAK